MFQHFCVQFESTPATHFQGKLYLILHAQHILRRPALLNGIYRHAPVHNLLQILNYKPGHGGDLNKQQMEERQYRKGHDAQGVSHHGIPSHSLHSNQRSLTVAECQE